MEVDGLPRRPLVLLCMAFITLLGLMGDLGLRNRSFAKAPGPPITEIDQLTVNAMAAREKPPVASVESAAQQLVSEMAKQVSAMAITVNGNDVVAVPDAKAAQMVRDQILNEYKSTILRDASAVEQLQFQETIAWRPKQVAETNIRSVEEAINVLKLGTDKLVKYVVKSGDTGWDIARSYNLTTEQLAKANPTADIETLQIGQLLNVTYKEPYVHTVSVSKRQVKEGIPFTEQIEKDPDLWPWQYEVVTPGQWGTRALTLREYREDGRIVKTEVLENQVLQDPKPQIARQGIKQIPAIGTGTLVYPLAGILTSSYGPRWGSFHNGIDIGAPHGSPVLAADSGMVVYRGWYGNYGYLLKIDHGGGKMVTWYGHLSRFSVALGDTVKQGQVIGYVGNTGFSTGSHLHYEVHVDGKVVNPLQFYR